MESTYTQLYVQLVFAVKLRQPVIKEDTRGPLEKYICGIVRNLKCKPLAIYCNPDHVHILFGLAPSRSVSEMAYAIKSNSSRWLSATYPSLENFSWQKGYGAFTYSRSAIDRVARYIHNQPLHHKTMSYTTEIERMLASEKDPDELDATHE